MGGCHFYQLEPMDTLFLGKKMQVACFLCIFGIQENSMMILNS